jgi:hypothetical protein
MQAGKSAEKISVNDFTWRGWLRKMEEGGKPRL